MISAKTIQVGKGLVGLTAGTGLSGTTIAALRNGGKSTLWLITGDEGGYPVGPGENLPPGVSLGSTDDVTVRRDPDELEMFKAETEPIHVILTYSA